MVIFCTLFEKCINALTNRYLTIYNCNMEKLEVFKALASPTRIQILDWLKDPESNFGDQEGIDLVKIGVCVSQIKEKLDMTQSTASQHLSILNKAGLVEYKRLGKWTYYKRNEQAIKSIGKVIEKEL